MACIYIVLSRIDLLELSTFYTTLCYYVGCAIMYKGRVCVHLTIVISLLINKIEPDISILAVSVKQHMKKTLVHCHHFNISPTV